jgi:hypothetical protein
VLIFVELLTSTVIPPISTKQRKCKQCWSTIPQISTQKRKCKQCWSTIPPISTKQKSVSSAGQQLYHFVLLILVELLSSTVYTFFCFVDIGGIVDQHCLHFLLFCWYWWNCWTALLTLQFHQYQQNKRKFKQWWSTIPPILTKQS